MRIQHNIMAMNAYRNYNTNTSALSKNLEKLSSGYKINRAGDDAAGLAISEKMRAQITGLNAAQKNVKDGVSLVKTAEGAMQEIQDMLNRMDYLATQSANGTYDNEVDRAALQKEVNQLKDEINRIADSANFNGIKLLDGSLDGSAKAAVAATSKDATGMLPEVGQILGTDTVLHVDQANAAPAATSMSVDLHNLEVDGLKNQTFTMQIGDTKLTGTLLANASAANGGTALTAADVAAALAGTDATKISFAYEDGTAYVATAAKFGEGEFSAADAGNGRVTFTQTNNADIDPEMKVSISAGTASASAIATSTTTPGADATGDTKATYTSNDAIAKVTLAKAKTGNEYTVTIAGKSLDVAALAADGTTESDLVDAWITKFNADNSGNGFTAAKGGTNGIVITKAGDNTGTAAIFDSLGLTGGTPAVAGTDSTLTIDGVVAAGTPVIADKGDTNTYDVEVDNRTEVVTAKLADDEATVGAAWVAEYNKTGGTGENDKATASYDAATKKIKLEADVAGDDSGDVAGTPTTQTTTALGSLSGGTGVKGSNNPATSASSEIDFTGKTGKDVIGGTITVGDKTYEFVKTAGDETAGNVGVTVAENATAAQIATALAGATAPSNAAATAAANKVTFTSTNTGTASDADVAVTIGKTGGDPKLSGDYNVSTTNIEKKGEPAGERLASTYFDLTKAMASDGSTITIGKEDYTFTTNEADKGQAGKVYVGDLDLNKKDDLIEAADRLTKAAAANKTYTVGHDGKRMTFTEVKNQTEFAGKEALTSYENIEKSFGFKTAAKDAVEADDSKALTLQIGDTSDDYNQLKVTVGDMHVDAMGIDGIDISNQAGAASAIQTIKSAINYVSGVRGDLGAIQNRLEHTANNLSVMAENITDAESTIRDTDVAEEMMSYVKNNILVQSAQAMLAQANQVPQGVLQLLG